MNFLVKLAQWGAAILFGGFFAVVFWKLFTGVIPLNGLLDGDIRHPDKLGEATSAPSTGRSQTVLVTLYIAAWYLMHVIHNPRSFPNLPNAMVGTLAGSHAVYLAGKAQSLYLGRLRDFLNRRTP